MSKLTVRRVHCRHASFDVFIGRAAWCPPGFTGDGHDGYFGNSVFTIAAFKPYFKARIGYDAEFKQRVLALRGKRLGCFCAPKKPCHGDVIVDWLEAQDGLTEEDLLAALAARIGAAPNQPPKQ